MKFNGLKLLSISLAFLFLLLLETKLRAQVKYTDIEKAEYLLDIVKYIKWPDLEKTDSFKISILDDEQDFNLYFDSVASGRKTVHDLPIQLIHIHALGQLSGSQVLFAGAKQSDKVKEIVEKVKGTHTLLITENFEFHHSMINFVVVNGIKRYEVNEHLLNENGLKATPLFLALSINTRQDWEALFYEADSVVLAEKEIVKEQHAKIKLQDKAIDEQFNRIVSQKNKILLQQSRLQQQKEAMKQLSESISEKQKILQLQKADIKAKELELNKFKIEIQEKSRLYDSLQNNLNGIKNVIDLQNKKMYKVLDKVARQRQILYLFSAFILLLIAFVIVIFRNYKIKKRINRELEDKNYAILERNEEITQQKEEILAQRDEIQEQRDKILEQNTEITDSILYARRIQNAILPRKNLLKEILPEHFIFYLPRDIVSGDFYWTKRIDDKLVIAISDCTGHGVPGAFMSMLGVSFLNELVTKNSVNNAAKILNELRQMVKTTLAQTGQKDETKDGMDMVLCIIDETKMNMQFACANNPLYLIRRKELTRYAPDKMPIGIFINDNLSFANHSLELEKNDCLYMFSDGYVDQFGGKKGKKFGSKNFKQLLLDIHELPMNKQKLKIKENYYNWISETNSKSGSYDQVDDVLVFGMKI